MKELVLSGPCDPRDAVPPPPEGAPPASLRARRGKLRTGPGEQGRPRCSAAKPSCRSRGPRKQRRRPRSHHHGPWVWVSTDICVLHPPLPLPRPASGALPGTASLWPLEPQGRTARWLRWPWPRGGTSAGQHWRGPLGHGLFLPTPPSGFSVVPCSSAQHSSHTDGWPSV